MKKLLAIFISALYISGMLSCSDKADTLTQLSRIDTYATLSSEPDAEYITILGDLQTMVYEPNNRMYLVHTVNWLNKMQRSSNGQIKAVLQNGDLTERNTEEEWNFVKSVFVDLGENVPLIYSTGNHDYDWARNTESLVKIYSRNSTRINSFPIQESARQALVERFESERLENSLYSITVKGVDYYILALEFAPRAEVFEWALELEKSNPDKPFIIINHEFLTDSGNRVQTEYSFAKIQIADENYVAPKDVWEKLIYPYDNVRIIICGHNAVHGWRTDPNIAGRDVPQLMFNLQHYPHGGDGLVMMLKTCDGHKFSSTVFSTITGDTIHEVSRDFEL